jgi:hypothetical protein
MSGRRIIAGSAGVLAATGAFVGARLLTEPEPKRAVTPATYQAPQLDGRAMTPLNAAAAPMQPRVVLSQARQAPHKPSPPPPPPDAGGGSTPQTGSAPPAVVPPPPPPPAGPEFGNERPVPIE